MKKSLYIFIFSVLGIFYIGSGIYFYKKSLRRQPKKTKESVILEVMPLSLIVMKELFNDFENENSLLRYSLSTKRSFSGKRSVKLDSNIEFGAEIVNSFSEIPYLNNLREIEISMKYWNEKINGEVIWVLEIDGQDGKLLSWEGDVMPDTLNKWGNYTVRFKIKNDFLKNSNRVKMYAWNKNKSTFYVDDIRVQFRGIENIYNTSLIVNNIKQSSFHFDLENDSLLNNTGSLTDELSLSGKYSSVMKGRDQTSVLICKNLERVVNDTLRNLTASVWIYPLTENVNCVLTLEVRSSDDEQIYWSGKSTEKMNLKARQWQKLNSLFNIEPEDYLKFNPDDEICIYLNNKSDATVYTDDFDVSFGPTPSRPGNQTIVDMNAREGGVYNYDRYHPPYERSFMQLTDIGNFDSPFLIGSDSIAQAFLNPYDLLFSGNFSGNAVLTDELLSINSKDLTLFHYCESKNRFVVDGVIPFDKKNFPYDNITTGDFNGDGKNEILLLSSGTSSMYSISAPPKSSCSDNINGISLNEMWKGKLENSTMKYFTGNYLGNNADELLLAGKQGNIILKGFENGTWKTILEENVPRVIFSDSSTGVSIKYLSDVHENIISIYSEHKIIKGQILDFKNNKLNRGPMPDESSLFNFFSSDDQLFPIRAKNSKREDIFSYNNRWRFELKLITHDKKGFYISSIPEFTGYVSDQNPKYYEIVRLVPGNFTGNKTELLCILRNCADNDFDGMNCKKFDSLNDLPNRIQVYSLPK